MTPPLSSRAYHHSLTSPYIHTYERQTTKHDTNSNESPALLHSAYPLEIHYYKIPIHTCRTTLLVPNSPTYFHSIIPPFSSPIPTLLSHHALKIFTRHTHRTLQSQKYHVPKTNHTVQPPRPPARHNTQPNTPLPYLAEARHSTLLHEKYEMGYMNTYLAQDSQLRPTELFHDFTAHPTGT
jgi:hypothetical protein